MKRMQIQLDEPTYRTLRARAFEREVSVSALIRELLRAALELTPAPRKRLENFGFVASGASVENALEPISERHDEALAEDFAG